MTAANSVTVGTIGGPATFAGQATEQLRKWYPEFREPNYFPSGTAMFAALRNHEVDAAIAAGANLVDGYSIMARMVAERGSELYVIASEAMSFNSLLLGKQGSTLAGIRVVHAGHGSIATARAFIKSELPLARSAVYDEPLAAGRMIAQSDGTEAVVGTRRFAEELSLAVLADVDGGEINGEWWAISTRPVFDPAPAVVLVTGCFADDGQMSGVIAALASAGYKLSGAWPFPSGKRLLECDYLLRFRGTGPLIALRNVIEAQPQVRLAGALTPRRV